MHDERPYDDDGDASDDDDAHELQPGDPDYDLSEQHGYTWEPQREGWPPRWLIAAVSFLVILGLVLPAILIVLRYW